MSLSATSSNGKVYSAQTSLEQKGSILAVTVGEFLNAAVIRMPMISKESLVKLIKEHYPAIREAGANELAEVFLELHAKCENGEISSKALDLRGLIGSIGMMEKGLNVYTALDMGITNKSFDEYEQTLIRDTIRARISRIWLRYLSEKPSFFAVVSASSDGRVPLCAASASSSSTSSFICSTK